MEEWEIEEAVEKHQGFILKTACRYSGRFISKSDDEYSIALIAFAEGLKSYDDSRGNLLAYLTLVIRSRLYDYFASQKHRTKELAVDPYSFTELQENDPVSFQVQKAVGELSLSTEDNLRLEILAVGDSLAPYGITFSELVSASPKAEKTRESCKSCIRAIIRNGILARQLFMQKQLPIKELEKICDLPRKTIERHRKYIIAAVVILSGEYPYLAEYLKSLL